MPSPVTLPEKPRLLITRTDRIGDLVLSTPVFRAIREKFPSAWIAALTFTENREIVEGNPYLDEVILYDKKGAEKGPWGNWRFARALTKKRFDAAVHLHATNRMHAVGWLAGIPVRIGWERKCAWALTHAFEDRKHEGLKHEALYNFELLEPLGVRAPAEPETFFPLEPRAAQSLERLLKNFPAPSIGPKIILAPGASCASKRWPAAHFGRLAALLAARTGASFFVIGSAADRPLFAKIRQAAPEVPFYDLTGRLSLAMLGVLLKNSDLLISNDSGPVHIASAVGTRVISIFGRYQPGLSPVRWRPLGSESRVIWKDVGCRPCLAHRCEIHFLCLDVVSPEEVAAEAEAFLPVGPA